jgi:hypothetical protein
MMNYGSWNATSHAKSAQWVCLLQMEDEEFYTRVVERLAQPVFAGFQNNLAIDNFYYVLKRIAPERVDILLDEYSVEVRTFSYVEVFNQNEIICLPHFKHIVCDFDGSFD